MILFSLYFLFICLIIYKYDLFGICKDESLNRKFFLTAFVVKTAGIAAFHFVYSKIYGSINYSDTYNYFHESEILHAVAKWNFTEYLKLIFGFQDDSQNSELFKNFLRYTTVWDNDPAEAMYNDNRLLLRFHSIIHFISNHNYYVHALVSSLLAFIGMIWIYKAFSYSFRGKELLLFACWLLFPGLWFWSAAVLKEGPALWIMGMMLVSLKRIIKGKNYTLKNVMMLIVSAGLSVVYKQYVLFPVLLFSFIYCLIEFKNAFILGKGFTYLIVLFILFVSTNGIVKLLKGKSLTEMLSQRQAMFMDMSDGGLFLLDKTKFIRLPYDTLLIKKIRTENEIDKIVSIRLGAKFAYCEHSHQQDTLYCMNNTDTLSEYLLYYSVPKAKSGIHLHPVGITLLDVIKSTPEVLYCTLFKPFFFDARNAMDMLASSENALILFSFILLIYYAVVNKNKNFAILYWLSCVLFVLIIIGITSPNIGAIQRYRVLVMPFLFIGTLFVSKVNDGAIAFKLFKNRRDN